VSDLEMLSPQNSAIAFIDFQPAMYQISAGMNAFVLPQTKTEATAKRLWMTY
jgi:hypothetical protein